jgi:hypothetical protein
MSRRGDFLWPAGEPEVRVRVPDPRDRGSERAVEHIAPEELQAGMRLLLRQAGGIDEESLLSQTARLFGFGKLGETIRQHLAENVAALRQQGVLTQQGEAVTLAR